MEHQPPGLSLIWQDRITGTKGYAVIDRTIRGLSGGGTRVRTGVTLDEVARLARGMTLKNGAFNIPIGGAKGGLDADPTAEGFDELLIRYVKALSSLYRGEFSTAEDLGITQERIDAAFRANGFAHSVNAAIQKAPDPERTRQVMHDALHVSVDGMMLADCIGGYGVARSTLSWAKLNGLKPDDLTVSVQGLGTMGGATALYLQRAGARVVAAADARGCMVNVDGLDIERLLMARNRYAEVDRSALGAGDTETDRDEWLTQDATVLVPAAVADTIDEGNCHLVTAQAIVEAANIPTTRKAEAMLTTRGVSVVPDFVANGGTNAWFWWILLDQLSAEAAPAFAMLDKAMNEIMEAVIGESKSKDISLRQAAETVALANSAAATEQYGE